MLAGTVLAVCYIHGDAFPADRFCHAVFAGSIVLAGMALGLAMEDVSESRSTIRHCQCGTKRNGQPMARSSASRKFP